MCSEWEKYSAELNSLSVQHVKNINLPEDVFEPGEVRPTRPLRKPAPNGTTAPVTQRKRNAPTEGHPPPPAKRQQSSAAAAG
ncbi:hypothetical protein F5Y09DRAFT_302462 [Xylaria sp. FL1042]|nr:hypothetical protein F5Y09DRAFT_302462 [Xylaria sp. FL1042]